MEAKQIEFWEHEYLEQIYYLLAIDINKLIDGLNTKEKIRDDWEQYIMGNNLSEIATGSERIFYWLFNQLGIPNSAPVGSDLFFETYNAFVHIDIKTVTKSNITADFNNRIIIGKNQNSYAGKIIKHNGEFKETYHPQLPTFYTINGKRKICLTYFIVILNEEIEKDIKTIILTCMPNGELAPYYEDRIVNNNSIRYGPLAPGKNDTEARFRYIETKYFKLLENKPLRTKILYWDEKIALDETLSNHLENLKQIYDEQKTLENG